MIDKSKTQNRNSTITDDKGTMKRVNRFDTQYTSKQIVSQEYSRGGTHLDGFA